MKLYMGFSGDEYAILIFAHNAREAKKVAYQGLNGLEDTEYIHVRVRLIREEAKHLWACADPKKLEAGETHYEDSPPCCWTCESWGVDINPNTNGECKNCDEQAALQAKVDRLRHTLARVEIAMELRQRGPVSNKDSEGLISLTEVRAALKDGK